MDAELHIRVTGTTRAELVDQAKAAAAVYYGVDPDQILVDIGYAAGSRDQTRDRGLLFEADAACALKEDAR